MRLTGWEAWPTSHGSAALVPDNTHPLSTSYTQGFLYPSHGTTHLYKGDLVPQKLRDNPVDIDACWEGPLDKGCRGLGPWFRKPLVYPPYSHERTTASSLSQNNLKCQRVQMAMY